MLEKPQIIHTVAQLAAVIRFTIPRADIQTVMGPAMQEVMATVAAQGLTPTGPMYSHHFKMDPLLFDFEVGVPVLTPVSATGRVKAGQLPAATVARTVYCGPYEGLGAGWREFMDWITAEGHFDLTEAQKRKPYLGSGMASPVPFELKLTQQGTLLLATDGLFKYADPLAITDTVRAGLSEAPEALQRLATGDLALVVAGAGRIAPWIGFLNRFKVG